MWAEESNFYHIYPLGLCASSERNNFDGSINNSLYKIEEQIEHLKNLGINAIYFGPLFESSAHGYDTADYYKIDSRLGSNENFERLGKKLHENGIKYVVDGVFNHVGRDFWAFKDIKANKKSSNYCDWFFINWNCNNRYNDGFSYQDWEGCDDLVKLNLKNPYVKEHLFNAVKFWIEKFDIDGLRLDVAYCLDKDFMKELHNFTKNLKNDFWLLGEAVHGDYNSLANPEMLDSVTNYECYKGLYSSFNDKNMFEIAHSVKRQENLYKGKHLYSFLDNHDVSRIASSLKDKRDLKLVYSLMFVLPGVPSIYYQSEFGIEGAKSDGDKALRPKTRYIDYNDLTNHIKNLCELNKKYKSFSYGQYEEIKLTNEFFCFARNLNEENTICAINISDKEEHLNYQGLEITLPPKSEQIYINNTCVSFERG
ncbi:MAG: alpha-amylase family glycosyl hydrolase [Candidatus Gastranaerophilaceae bacterium]